MQIDENLLRSCLAKERAAQKKMYELLLPYLRAVAVRYLKDNSYAKDVLQESFVKIFHSLEKYDPQKAPFKSWSAKIVINSCLNYNDRVIRGFTEELVVELHEDSISPEALENLSDDEMLAILKKMPKGYFEIFNLFVIDGYSHQEIAKMLNISAEVSRKKLSRAKNWLRKSKSISKNESAPNH